MDTPKDVRKQFIISSIEIRLRVANWGSAFEHRFYAGRSKALYLHFQAIPVTFNVGVEVIGYIQ